MADALIGGETGSRRRLPHEKDTKTGAVRSFASHFWMLRGGAKRHPGVFLGPWPCWDLDFGLSAFRTMSASPLLCCNLLTPPQEASMMCSKQASRPVHPQHLLCCWAAQHCWSYLKTSLMPVDMEQKSSFLNSYLFRKYFYSYVF